MSAASGRDHFRALFEKTLKLAPRHSLALCTLPLGLSNEHRHKNNREGTGIPLPPVKYSTPYAPTSQLYVHGSMSVARERKENRISGVSNQ